MKVLPFCMVESALRYFFLCFFFFWDKLNIKFYVFQSGWVKTENLCVIELQHLEKGYYIEPTIITDVNTSMQIWKEEVFGPVICIKTFKTEEEAIELANDTE